MRNLLKHTIVILLIFSGGMNIALLTKGQNTDKVMLDIADHSYFIGCHEASQDAPTCHGKSKLYRKDMKEKVGLKDRGE